VLEKNCEKEYVDPTSDEIAYNSLWSIFDRLNTVIAGSIPVLGMDMSAIFCAALFGWCRYYVR
jgi:hypothetical protein